jgi:hypothetical protein
MIVVFVVVVVTTTFVVVISHLYDIILMRFSVERGGNALDDCGQGKASHSLDTFFQNGILTRSLISLLNHTIYLLPQLPRLCLLQ